YKFKLTVTDNRGEADSDEIMVTVTGMIDPDPDPDTLPGTDTIPDQPSNSPLPNVQEVVVYPNPATSDVILQLNTYHRGNSVAVIYDNMGREVKRVNFVKNQNKFLQRLPTAALGKGLFYVDVMIDRKGRFRSKFIKR
ncbi:MAG: T9SS type A sorting domain-containing protein, partial [Chitinophagaceae bacterium]